MSEKLNDDRSPEHLQSDRLHDAKLNIGETLTAKNTNQGLAEDSGHETERKDVVESDPVISLEKSQMLSSRINKSKKSRKSQVID